MPRALVTGASSGIGASFAEGLAKSGSDVVLIARNQDRLQATANLLRDRFDVVVETVVADLETADGIARVVELLQDNHNPIDFLVNNAGFGLKGDFVQTPVDKHLAVLNVNASAVLQLTHAALGKMLERGSGNILNVSSVAAFTPGVRPSSTYAASKAFVAAFSEGLAPAVRGTGVHISVVCPGWTKSSFHETAGIGASKIPSFLWLTPQFVAETALADHCAGKVVSVPGLAYKVIVGVSRAAPRPLITALSNLAGRLSH